MRTAVALAARCVLTVLLGLAASVVQLAGIADSDSCEGCTPNGTLAAALWIGCLIAFLATIAYAVLAARRRHRRGRS
jgi:hypothetical protein